MQTKHKIFTVALITAGALALPSASALAGGWGWDAGCGCQRPIAYVQPQVYAPAPEVVNVVRPRVVYQAQVVYQPHVVYETVPAIVAHAPVAHGCCGGRGLFSGGYYGAGYGGFYGHHHGYYGGGYGGVYGGYGHAQYGYGPTD